MLGYEQISLGEDEFTTQWKTIATEEERDSLLKEHTSITTDAGELTLSGQSYYEDAIGEATYNSYTDILYVLPDSICEKLMPVIKTDISQQRKASPMKMHWKWKNFLQKNIQSRQKAALCMEYGSVHYRRTVQ